MTESLMKTYGRMDVAFTKGEGAWLIDEAGNRYLDGLAGLGVTALGHADPVVTEAISQQASLLMHTSNIYRIPAQEELADLLISITGMDNMFFGNSGAEANECAIKSVVSMANKTASTSRLLSSLTHRFTAELWQL